MKKQALHFAAAIAILIFSSSCGALMGSLRPDLDDGPSYEPPTVGGRWAERGFLAESMPEGADAGRYAAVGHSERAPASMGGRGGQDSWIDPMREDANRREFARDDELAANEDGSPQVSFSNTPNLAPPVRRLYKNGNRATRADFIDESPNEGSLWASDGQTNYYFTKNKIRGVGDIITVTLEDEMIRDLGVEVRRTLNEKEREIELGLAESRALARMSGGEKGAGKTDAVSNTQAAASRSPGSPTDKKASDENAPKPQITPGDVDVSKSLEVKAGDTMMAEIIERYPNGNYKIRATKKLLYKNGAPRLVNLIGVVKGADISEEDTVASGKLYEYRLEAIR